MQGGDLPMPEPLFTYYMTMENEDLTEGRGGMRAVSYWSIPESAALDAKGRGVMGAGDGDVVEVVLVPDNNYHRPGKLVVDEKKIYGYRKRPDGQWDYGFLDFRDLPDADDPEYKEYLRLAEKFGPPSLPTRPKVDR